MRRALSLLGLALAAGLLAGPKPAAEGARKEPLQRAWTVARSLEPGQALAPEDLTVVWRPAKLLPARALQSAPPAESVAWRSVVAGSILCEKDLGPGPWIIAGSKVRLVLKMGALRLEDDGILLQGAAPGMQAHVQGAHSTRALRGRVDQAGIVVVED